MPTDYDPYTLDEVLEIEKSGTCPDCGSSLDTGAGFARRDLECPDCDFSLSYPLNIYLENL